MRYTAGGGEGESVGNIGCGQRRCGGKHGTAGGENPVGAQKAAGILAAWNPTLKIDTEGNEVHITTEIEDTSEVVLALVNAGARVYEMRNESINLEDFFIERLG